MGSVFPRGAKLWLKYKDANGRWTNAPTGLAVGQEKAADELLAKIEARVRAGEAVATGPVTVRRYAERWSKAREAKSSGKLGILQLAHVLPILGDLRIETVRPRDVQALVAKLRAAKKKRGEGLLAPRTVRNIYGTLHTMFEDAVADELIAANPCKLKRGQLPKKVDKDPLWRSRAIYTREELELLISHPKVPAHRRVRYALMFLGGLRPGEASAVRWRHYDPHVKPLGRIDVVAAYDSNNGREKSVKTDAPRTLPVHKVLAKLLAAWKLTGWAKHVGRRPTPDNLMVPRVLGDDETDFYAKKAALDELYLDLEALGYRRRRQHDMRRTFISLARADGARPNLLEWVTHGPRGDIINQYTTPPWETLCEQVACLNVQLREGQVVELPKAVAGGADAGPYRGLGTALGTVSAKLSRSQRKEGWGTRIRT